MSFKANVIRLIKEQNTQPAVHLPASDSLDDLLGRFTTTRGKQVLEGEYFQILSVRINMKSKRLVKSIPRQFKPGVTMILSSVGPKSSHTISPDKISSKR